MNEVIQSNNNNVKSHATTNLSNLNTPTKNFSEPNIVVLHDKNFAELDKQYGEDWEQPIFFDEIETPDIPAALLPDVLGEFASALATATETPEALTVMVILGVLSVAASKRFVVSPKSGWQEPVNIYTLIALPPANHKSLVLKSCTQPLVEWEKEQEILHGHSIKRERAEYKTQEKIIESLRAQTAKTKDLEEQNQLRKKVAELEANLKTPPSLPNLFGNDFTPEALVNRMHEQGGRYAIFSDEGGITETLSGLYSNQHANVDILLKGIDGGDMRVGRSGKNFQLNPFLTITLTVQPVVIQNMMVKQAFKGNGLLKRFLYALPKSKLGYRTHDKPPVMPALQKAFNYKIKTLLNIQP